MKVKITFEADSGEYDLSPNGLSKLLGMANALSGRKDDDGYSGFLITKCQQCGRIRAFNTKAKITEAICSCGGMTPLLGTMRPVAVRCPSCGNFYHYLTNIQDNDFDIECLNCKTVLHMEFDKLKGEFTVKAPEGGETVDR